MQDSEMPNEKIALASMILNEIKHLIAPALGVIFLVLFALIAAALAPD